MLGNSWKLAGLMLFAAGQTWAQAVSAPPTIAQFVKKNDFESVVMSPGGDYIAVTVPFEDRTALAIIRLSDMKRMVAASHGKNTAIEDIRWVSADRLLYSVSIKIDDLAEPQSLGEIYGINADGKGSEILIGQRAGVKEQSASNIKQRGPEQIGAVVIDDLPDDPDNVLIETWKLTGSEDAYSQVEKMNIFSGRRVTVTKAPVRGAHFLTDHSGVVRFALGIGLDNRTALYYRAGEKADWQLINDQHESFKNASVLGFSADDKVAYFDIEEDQGPDAVYAFDTQTQTSKKILQDDNSDPWRVLRSPFDDSPYGVVYMDGKPRAEYFDPSSENARLNRSLEAGFPGQVVVMDRAGSDKKHGLLTVFGDRLSGDVYRFDYQAKHAELLLSFNQLDPEQMVEMTPVSMKARDGLPLEGYLLLPKGSSGKNLPLVVNPHGGPWNIQDEWGFDSTAQLLASRGYAVLKVNYRGSSGYGKSFEAAGYHQWGRQMQDDVTDATRWAIAQGIADPRRICIFGASYGGYAALMGTVKEPDLYRCAAGLFGVYDLPALYSQGDSADSIMWQNDLKEHLGKDGLADLSPSLHADRVKVPVLLGAGREDQTAPPSHTEKMRDALQKLGKPVETTIYDAEGHGFYKDEDSVDFYTRLLAFLDRNIGPGAGQAGSH